jgi:hypothetical protein
LLNPITKELGMNEVITRDASVYVDLASQIGAIETLGNYIARSGFAGCDKVEQGTIIAFTCLAERITPLEFTRTYDIIQGRPTKKAAVMLAEFREKMGGDFDWIDDGEDCKKATIHLSLFEGKKECKPVSFTIEEAQTKGLAQKANWKIHCPEMLRARCITKALRMYAPEIAAGIYSPEELGLEAKPRRIEPEPIPTLALDNEIAEGDWHTSFKNLVNERNASEVDRIYRFVDRTWPEGIPLDKKIKAVKHFDTFLQAALNNPEDEE